jgi:hypothetical protein
VTRISDLEAWPRRIRRHRSPQRPLGWLEFAQMISIFSSANARPNSGIGLETGGTRCYTKRSNVELIVVADEADQSSRS